MKNYSNVDAFLDDADEWKVEISKLREILLTCDVDEEIKWGKPCYTVEEGNIAIIQPFKKYLALMFFKGALLEDTENNLIQMTKNTQAARQLRFTELEEIKQHKGIIKQYVNEAIEVEKSGEEVDFKETKDFPIPEEFQKKLDEMPELKEAFDNLTPGRQRGYLLYFGDAKQSKTRARRVRKYIPKILEGKGFHDQ